MPVEQCACLKAVVKPADHAVEQVTSGGRVPVALLASAPAPGKPYETRGGATPAAHSRHGPPTAPDAGVPHVRITSMQGGQEPAYEMTLGAHH